MSSSDSQDDYYEDENDYMYNNHEDGGFQHELQQFQQSFEKRDEMLALRDMYLLKEKAFNLKFCSPTHETNLYCQNAINELEKEMCAKLKEVSIYGQQSAINDITFLKRCVTLQKLSVQSTQVTDLPLVNTIMLKFIYIRDIRYLLHINSLKNCYQIEQIVIGDLNITSIAVITKLNKLQKLTIFRCYNIKDYYVLEECTHLTSLKVYETHISDISPITNLQYLNTVELMNNDKVLREFQKNICDNKEEIQKFLDKYKQTEQYQNYLKTLSHGKRNALIKQEQSKQINEYNNQLQEYKQQKQHNIINQNTWIQQIKQNADQMIQQANQQNKNLQQQLQQQSQNLNLMMQQMMQQMTDQNNQLLQQIKQVQINQDLKNDMMDIQLQRLSEKQADDSQKNLAHLANFIQILETDK